MYEILFKSGLLATEKNQGNHRNQEIPKADQLFQGAWK